MAETKKNGAVLPPYNPDNIYNMGTGKDCGVPRGIIKVKEHANIEPKITIGEGAVFACPKIPEDGQHQEEKGSVKVQRVSKAKSFGKNRR